MKNTNERLIRVNKLGGSNSIGVGQEPIGIPYRFSIAPGGAIARICSES